MAVIVTYVALVVSTRDKDTKKRQRSNIVVYEVICQSWNMLKVIEGRLAGSWRLATENDISVANLQLYQSWTAVVPCTTMGWR